MALEETNRFYAFIYAHDFHLPAYFQLLVPHFALLANVLNLPEARGSPSRPDIKIQNWKNSEEHNLFDMITPCSFIRYQCTERNNGYRSILINVSTNPQKVRKKKSPPTALDVAHNMSFSCDVLINSVDEFSLLSQQGIASSRCEGVA